MTVVSNTTSSLLASSLDDIHAAAETSNRSDDKLRERHESSALRFARVFIGYPPSMVFALLPRTNDNSSTKLGEQANRVR